jgi:ribose/xylose/arabinose/galactoside ABC-type transport system permease subunit
MRGIRESVAASLAEVRSWLKRPWVGPLLALIVVYAIFAALRPDTFLSALALKVMLRQTVVVGLCAVGMTLVIALAGIDLSVGSIVALVAVVIAHQLKAGRGVATAVALGVLVGLACGFLNGALTAALRITPFIVTLSTMSILRGLAKGLAKEQPISAQPQGLETMMTTSSSGLNPFPPAVWLTAVAALIGSIALGRARFGRHLLATGSNEAAARLAGISVTRVTLLTYSQLGLLAGLAGVVQFAKLTVGDPTDSGGLELSVIAAVVIGGGSLSGGQGSVMGSMFGAMLMTVIATGSTHMGIANWVQEILTGFIIVTACALERFRRP